MAPFRELLSKKQKWYWDETLTSIFNESKEKIITEIVCKSFHIPMPFVILLIIVALKTNTPEINSDESKRKEFIYLYSELLLIC